jgi:transcription elongation factor S-II
MKAKHDSRLISKYNFDDLLKYKCITEDGKKIPKSVIMYARSTIKSNQYVIKLNRLLKDIELSIAIEEGIFEFAMLHAMGNGLQNHFMIANYEDRFNEIMLNLDSASYLENRTLLPALKKKKIRPQFVAFLYREQMHPARWLLQLEKRQKKLDAENNIPTTDIYKCYECGERKAKLTEFQLRGADEPMTKFITCMVCYATFTEN